MKDKVLCEICLSRPAKVVILRRRHENADRTFVCLECASERSRLYAGTSIDLQGILNRMEKKIPSESSAYSCRSCGATLADIIADGRPGCCSCYMRFAGEIEQAVQAAQGRTYHTGKAPKR